MELLERGYNPKLKHDNEIVCLKLAIRFLQQTDEGNVKSVNGYNIDSLAKKPLNTSFSIQKEEEEILRRNKKIYLIFKRI